MFLGDSKHSRCGSQIEEGEVQMLVHNWRIHPYISRIKNGKQLIFLRMLCTYIPNQMFDSIKVPVLRNITKIWKKIIHI